MFVVFNWQIFYNICECNKTIQWNLSLNNVILTPCDFYSGTTCFQENVVVISANTNSLFQCYSTFFFVAVLIFGWMRVAVLVSIRYDGDGFRDGGLHRRLLQELLQLLLVHLTCRGCDAYTTQHKPSHIYRHSSWATNTHKHYLTVKNWDTHQQLVLNGLHTL